MTDVTSTNPTTGVESSAPPALPDYTNVKLYSKTLPILLRTPEERDDAAVHEITSDPAIYDNNQWLARRASISEADALQKIHKMRGYAQTVPPARIELVVVLLSAPGAQEDGQVIGLSGIREYHERPGKRIAEVGASIITAQKGKGFYIEALKLSIDFAFEQGGANAIQVLVHEDSEKKLELLKDEFGWKRGAVDGQGKFRRFDSDKAAWAETKQHFGKGGSGGFAKKLGKFFKGS